MKKMDIFSEEWCNIVFEGRPKEYGAYEMRQRSSKRHRVSIISTLLFFVGVFTLPGLIKSMIPDKRETNVEVTAMTKVDLEKNKPKDIEQPIIEPEQKIKSTMKFTPPEIKDDADVKDEDLMKTQDEVNTSKLTISTNDVVGNSDDADAIDIADLNNKQSQVDETNYEKPHTIVEVMPEFPGGDAARVKFLAENLKYPPQARENGIQGTVFVTFVVGKSGTISEAKIIRGIGGGCDEEAIRVVRMMPSWIPGKQNGRQVPVQFNLPIKFSLE